MGEIPLIYLFSRAPYSYLNPHLCSTDPTSHTSKGKPLMLVPPRLFAPGVMQASISGGIGQCCDRPSKNGTLQLLKTHGLRKQNNHYIRLNIILVWQYKYLESVIRRSGIIQLCSDRVTNQPTDLKNQARSCSPVRMAERRDWRLESSAEERNSSSEAQSCVRAVTKSIRTAVWMGWCMRKSISIFWLPVCSVALGS